MSEPLTDEELEHMSKNAEGLSDRMLEIANGNSYGEIVLASIAIIVVGISRCDTLPDREQALVSAINILRERCATMELEKVDA